MDCLITTFEKKLRLYFAYWYRTFNSHWKLLIQRPRSPLNFLLTIEMIFAWAKNEYPIPNRHPGNTQFSAYFSAVFLLPLFCWYTIKKWAKTSWKINLQQKLKDISKYSRTFWTSLRTSQGQNLDNWKFKDFSRTGSVFKGWGSRAQFCAHFSWFKFFWQGPGLFHFVIISVEKGLGHTHNWCCGSA